MTIKFQDQFDFWAKDLYFQRHVGSKLALRTKNAPKNNIIQTQLVYFAYFETRKFAK